MKCIARQLRVQSSLTLPGTLQAIPCTVLGLYVPSSGTLIIQTVVADGGHYDLSELDNSDIANFYDELIEVVTQLDFPHTLEV